MPQTLTTLLVGAHFRPPAKTLLANLPAGTELILQPEPENPYDPGAIQVRVASRNIIGESAKLEADLAGQGFCMADIAAESEWQLGYVARDGNKDLAARPECVSNSRVLEFMSGEAEWRAELAFGPNGEPQVRIHQL